MRQRLLAWYRGRRRPMPWRGRRDPYAVWVAEVMLQQTRVATAGPYFERWMKRFPTVQALAAADEHDVLAAWSGLGYYSRARNLRCGAAQVVREHGGRVPESAGALRRLPGVGPYTAAAVASIAFGEPVAAVDGNVTRVVARLQGIGEVATAAARRRVQAAAARLIDPQDPGAWNQAMMDLGSEVCTPRSPDCAACPVAPHCTARTGDPEAFGRTPAKRPPRRESVHFARLTDAAGRILLVQNPATGLLAGMWSLPGGSADRPLATWVQEQAGARADMGEDAARVRHVFSHRVWDMAIRTGRVDPAACRGDVAWVHPRELADWPLAKAMRKAVAATEEASLNA